MKNATQQTAKRNKRFLIGVVFIIGSSAYGWIGLIGGFAIGIKYGRFWIILGWAIWGISWITYLIGFLLAGSTGIHYTRTLAKRLFKKRKKQKA